MSDTSARACSCSRRRVRFFAPAIFSAALLTWSLPLAANPPSQPNTVPDLAQLEIQMWRLINRDRGAPSSLEETRGLARPLQWDDRLAAAARQHSEEMARHGFFSHQGLDGSLPYLRISRAGIQWSSVGENLAEFPDVVQAEAAFMNEPKFQENHRGNILNRGFTHVGVGIARGADGLLYITQDFASFR
jgi:uncharacterized protein YkwD